MISRAGAHATHWLLLATNLHLRISAAGCLSKSQTGEPDDTCPDIDADCSAYPSQSKKACKFGSQLGIESFMVRMILQGWHVSD